MNVSIHAPKNQVFFTAKTEALSDKFARLEAKFGNGSYLNGAEFSLVDAVFGPVFRYFDVFDQIRDFGILADKPKLLAWRKQLANHPSIIAAASPDYNALLLAFLKGRNAYLGKLIAV